MANFNSGATYNANPYYSQPQQSMPQAVQQNFTQQFFPSPQGNVYYLNSTLEVANVPSSSGLNAAICLNDGMVFLKTIQNGQPMFWAYRLIPYQEETKQEVKSQDTSQLEERIKRIEEHLTSNRITTLTENTGGNKKNG